MLRGEAAVKIHGEMVPIRAEVAALENISAHADYEEILDWLGHLRQAPVTTFVTHGEAPAAEAMRRHIEGRFGWSCHVPEYRQSVEL